ncbi:hypothetical protein [Geminicoccus flavidas]|uniref:hypothetical protein n=1 Tax=Geminicoccus flavidas TaxID=2506407 RepID=UPI00190F95E3
MERRPADPEQPGRGGDIAARLRQRARPDRHHVHTSMTAADQNALHEALGGSGDAVLLAHD